MKADFFPKKKIPVHYEEVTNCALVSFLKAIDKWRQITPSGILKRERERGGHFVKFIRRETLAL